MRRQWSAINTYLIYELVGIPRERWLTCVPWQTSANYEERVQIQRFLRRRQKKRR